MPEILKHPVVVIYYPAGHSLVDGKERDNYDIAMEIARTFETGGVICIPELGIPDAPSWKIKVFQAVTSSESAEGEIVCVPNPGTTPGA